MPEQKENRRSSFFSVASFVRSSGDRGASVAVLRGTHGADFEAKAKIKRSGGSSCSCIFGGDKKEKFILLKGPFCFVFNSSKSTSPLYAISLVDMKATQNKAVALLQTNFGDSEYDLVFDNETTTKKFCKKIDKLSKSGKADEVRKQLGHEHLLDQTKSIVFAEKIALQKVDDQPPASLTSTEIMGAVPMSVL